MVANHTVSVVSARKIVYWQQSVANSIRCIGLAKTGLCLCRYSEDGLQGLTSLKNKDRAVASVLQSLAAEQCLEVYLAFVRQDEMGTADGYAGCWSMDEVCNTELHASKWMELDGSKHGIQGLHIDPKEFLQVQSRRRC